MLYEYIKQSAMPFSNNTLRDNKTSMSFAELFKRAENIGECLKGNKCGLLFEHEIDVAVGFLACLYAHITSVPLSFRYGELYNQGIIDALEIKTILGDGCSSGFSDDTEDTVMNDVATIMCTSGTSGAPKGAMLTYDGILNELLDIKEAVPVSHLDTFLIIRPLTHCSALICEFLYALINGANIIFCSDYYNPLEIVKAINEKGVTVMGATPSTLFQLSRFIGSSEKRITLVSSGECMTETVAKRIRAAFPYARIYNAYGLTEAGSRVSVLDCTLFDENPTSVGKPLKSFRYTINNGELMLSGQSLMKGYYGQEPSGTKWLSTGDLVCEREGLLYVEGRKDDMIIRYGVNIYPANIESRLKQDKRVKEVLVTGEQNKEVSQQVKVYIESEELTINEAFELCKKLLPKTLFPDQVYLVDQIGKTASGKVKRVRLFDNEKGRN